MGAKENRDLIVFLYRKAFQGPPERLDRLFAPNYQDHTFWGDLDGLKRVLASVREAFPGIQWKIDDLVVGQDKVAVRGHMLITLVPGPSRRIGFMSWFKILDGKIVEQWGFGDPLFDPQS